MRPTRAHALATSGNSPAATRYSATDARSMSSGVNGVEVVADDDDGSSAAAAGAKPRSHPGATTQSHTARDTAIVCCNSVTSPPGRPSALPGRNIDWKLLCNNSAEFTVLPVVNREWGSSATTWFL
ncbi:hypothetical protein Pelo_19304 [Pelomyxa schiedti]|nr:hypothetical protein Pelo_19304 [Pelomyxa schiedti]